MMRLLLTAFLVFSAASAQSPVLTVIAGSETNSSITTRMTYPTGMRSARIYYTEKIGSCPADATGMEYGGALRFLNLGFPPTIASVITINSIPALKANTTYCFGGCAHEADTADCNRAVDPLSNVVEGTTLPDTGGQVEPPIRPDRSWFQSWLNGPPTITGNTYTATTCAGIDTVLNSAAANADALNHEVLIDFAAIGAAGCSFSTSAGITLPNRANGATGWIVVRTNETAAQLPPFGVRRTLPWIAGKPTLRQTNGGFLVMTTGTGTAPTNPHHYWLLGLDMTSGTFAGTDCDDCRVVSNVQPTGGVDGVVRVTFTAAIPAWTSSKVCIGKSDEQARKVIGVPEANGCFAYTAVGGDPNSIDLTGVVGTGSYVSGGLASSNPSNIGYLFKPNTGVNNFLNTTDIVMDRCSVRGRGWPFKQRNLMHTGIARFLVMNSYFDNAMGWEGIVGGLPFGSASEAITIQQSGGFVAMVNNYIAGAGILSYKENPHATTDAGADGGSDWIFERNYFHLPNEWRACNQWTFPGGGCGIPNPASDGLLRRNRQQAIEFKSGRKVDIIGNITDGCWSNVAQPGQCLNIANGPNSEGLPLYMTGDMFIKYNTARNAVGFFQIQCGISGGGSVGDDGRQFDVIPSRRLYIGHNLIIGQRYYLDWFAQSATVAAGRVFQFSSGCSDIELSHNTSIDNKGANPFLINWGGRRHSRFKVEGNLWGYNGEGSSGGYFNDSTPAQPFPVTLYGRWSSANALAMFSGTAPPGTPGMMWRGNAPDTTTIFRNNFFIPGVLASTNTNYDVGGAYTSSNTATSNLTKFALCDPANGVLKDFLSTGNRCAGANTADDGTETANQRHEWVKFWSVTPKLSFDAAVDATALSQLVARLRYDSPWRRAVDGQDPGADIPELEAAQGLVKNARYREVGTTTAIISYTAPDAQACTVEYDTGTTWGVFPNGGRIPDGGGTRYRNVNLPGLVPGTVYQVRILCAVEQPVVTFKTHS